MRRPSASPIAVMLACAAVLAGAWPGGAAAPAEAQGSASLLWATVNVCDTRERPDTIGIRGSMPGSGVRAEEMYMRFQLQYFDVTDDKWHNIGETGDSGFISVGSAKFQRRQSGRNFTVQPPEKGAFRLRGTVTFEWRKGTEVVRRERKRTTAGRGNTAGADPRGFSAATCSVTK